MRLSASRVGFAGVVLGILASAVGTASAQVGEANAPAPAGGETIARCDHVGDRVGALLAIDQPLDAHLSAVAAEALCPIAALPRVRLWDAVALVRLEEFDRARGALGLLASDPQLAATARVIEAWSFLEGRDTHAFRTAVAGLPSEPASRLEVLAATRRDGNVARLAQRLDASLAAAVREQYAAFRRSRSKRPWLAGTLSALLPGLGQAYDGSWQSAALSLAINAVLIGGTVELARNRLYFASATTGLAASMFYVGNILNAADLARRYNDRASAPERRELERLLVPELTPAR